MIPCSTPLTPDVFCRLVYWAYGDRWWDLLGYLEKYGRSDMPDVKDLSAWWASNANKQHGPWLLEMNDQGNYRVTLATVLL